MSATRSQVLSLYRQLMRESRKITDYNFRMYALERVKHDFHNNKTVGDPAMLSSLIQKAQTNLDIVKRQVLVGQMYGEGHLVIENTDTSKAS